MFQFTDTKALSENGAWVHIKDNGRPAYWPDDDGKPDRNKPVRVKVLGPHSETYKERARRRAAKAVKETNGSVNFSKMSIGEIEEMIEKGEDASAKNWADRTIDWENMPGPDGEPISFSAENAMLIYTSYPNIIAQLDEDAGEIGDFLDLTSSD
jgi:hypothetical protein